ncbi:KilA-N domain-containing protein [Ursidibacter arcticus]
MSNLTILNAKVRQIDNLFSLNDLHAISGNEDKHSPFRFMRNDQTKELIAEIQKDFGTPDLVFKTLRGRNIQGTYACEEIALAYAMWISPKFHLVVLRAFIAMRKAELQNTQQNLPLAPEPKPDVVISYDQAYWIAKYLVRAKAFGKEVETFQRQLFETIGLPRYAGRNDLAAKGYDLAHEFNHKLDPFIEQVLPQTKQVKRLVHTNF